MHYGNGGGFKKIPHKRVNIVGPLIRHCTNTIPNLTTFGPKVSVLISEYTPLINFMLNLYNFDMIFEPTIPNNYIPLEKKKKGTLTCLPAWHSIKAIYMHPPHLKTFLTLKTLYFSPTTPPPHPPPPIPIPYCCYNNVRCLDFRQQRCGPADHEPDP